MDWKDRLNGMLTEKASRTERQEKNPPSYDKTRPRPTTLASGRHTGTRIPKEDRGAEATAHRVKVRRALSRQRREQGITSQQQKERAFKTHSTPHADITTEGWRDRLKALVLETYKPGSTKTTVDPRTGIKPYDGVGSMRLTPPQPNRTVDRLLRDIHQNNNQNKKS